MCAIALTAWGSRRSARSTDEPNHSSAPSQASRAARVLLVGDSPSFRSIMRELLQRRGYIVAGEVQCADTAMEATERLAPDVVLLDVKVADEHGSQLAARLMGAHPTVAVVVMSCSHAEDLNGLAVDPPNMAGPRRRIARSG